NSYVYDPNPNSFDCPPDSYHPPHPTYETYSYDSYGNDSHFGYDCQPQFTLNYESESGYIENYNSYPYDSSSLPQQYSYCTRCGVTPSLSTEEPDNSLSMRDEHLDTIMVTESDEFIKSSVENLIPIPSESEGIPDNMCDVTFHDNSPPLDVSKDQFEDFSDSDDEFSSTDDDSSSIENIDHVEASPPDSELVRSEVMEIVIPEIEALNDNPTPFYDPIISETSLTLTPFGESAFFLEEVNAFLAVEDEPTSSQFPQSYLNPEGDILLLEAFLNDNHSFDFMTKSSSTSLNSLLEETNTFDNSVYDVPTREEFTTFLNILFNADYEFNSIDDQSFFDEKFTGELTLLKSIPQGIDETDCDLEEDIHLIEKLLYDNLLPRPPEEFVFANSDTEIESFSPSPIPVKVWKKLIYPLLRITQCRRALKMMTMTLKGISSFLRTCLAMIPFQFLKLSHSILIFLRSLVLLQNHQMVIQEFWMSK
nr:hypothetical protein [Tanacetum cinerariifolium]